MDVTLYFVVDNGTTIYKGMSKDDAGEMFLYRRSLMRNENKKKVRMYEATDISSRIDMIP